ncbi:hypothetical protein OJAV_G00157000 [Oryzias javanicus]|uniref:Uncharacterized protein n=1 Tax=Oryzias javanicus TaxID=123683 RepID=A0A3S2PVU7_ORYJA|nr:hypothetical protein OJAV_G00157000 [Oryzias javanicus]
MPRHVYINVKRPSQRKINFLAFYDLRQKRSAPATKTFPPSKSNILAMASGSSDGQCTPLPQEGAQQQRPAGNPVSLGESSLRDRTCGEELVMDTTTTSQMLLEAQLLMSELEEKLDSFPAADLSRQSEGGAVVPEISGQADEDGETLIIEGFRFESAANREHLTRLS